MCCLSAPVPLIQINRRSIAFCNYDCIMQVLNSPTRYGLVSLSLHWGAVLVVILAWVLGVLGDELPRGSPRSLGLYTHILTGLAVFALTVIRLSWRLVDRSPAAEPTPFGDAWMGLGAKLAQLALYALLLLVPVTGIVLQFARGDSLPLFGLVDVASPWPPDRTFARAAKGVHELLAHGLMAVAGLHAAAAMVHHWIFKDRTLVRMLPDDER